MRFTLTCVSLSIRAVATSNRFDLDKYLLSLNCLSNSTSCCEVNAVLGRLDLQLILSLLLQFALVLMLLFLSPHKLFIYFDTFVDDDFVDDDDDDVVDDEDDKDTFLAVLLLSILFLF